ncbi:MAG: magnesium/cobalt transporter CorA [Candidatus Mcinerneyibacterium aminivorans]|uniref:Magnesium transport protein CorA n=1 Tax=Candidatus Mcinerneyibacterium aminivorans TaxID=2703815 RepID=A0A5D0MJA9_9BACT|nr:MAG: magnesium/cobalt transporter CorA [Candidatus Mcinerneyibacterium aminivorans]
MFKYFKKKRNLYEPPGYNREDDKNDNLGLRDKAEITLIKYNEKKYEIYEDVEVEELKSLEKNKFNYWVYVNSTYDSKVIKGISDTFGFHDLVIEDIISNNQRSKIEDWNDYIFMVMKFVEFIESEASFSNKEINMILKENILFTFHNNNLKFFEPISTRIENQTGNIRKYGVSYLFYALKDFLVDHSFLVLEKIDDILEDIEDIIVENPETKYLEKLYDTKKDLIMIRKSIWPLRDILNKIVRGDFELFDENAILYYRDLYDHVIQIIDIVESFRDVVSGQIDLYMSSISNKMNKVMQFLTVIGTIFIPLTFIAGVYGMNFKYMPELEWKFSYPVVWGVMIIITLIMLLIFKKKKWF